MNDRTENQRFGEVFAYFRWHCLWFTEPGGGDPCSGYCAWQCERTWKELQDG